MSIAPLPPPVPGTVTPGSTGAGASSGQDGGFAALVAALLGGAPQPAGVPAPHLVVPEPVAAEEPEPATEEEPEPEPAEVAVLATTPLPVPAATAAVTPAVTPAVDAPTSDAPAAPTAPTAPVAQPSPAAQPSPGATDAPGAAGATADTPAAPAAATEAAPAAPGQAAPPTTPAAPPAAAAALALTAPVAPTPVTGTPETRPAPVVAQLAPEVTRLVSRGDGVHRITMRLQPEALGEVRVTLTIRDGEVHVRLAAGDRAQQALLEGAPELRRVLELTGATETRVVVRDLAGGPAATPNASLTPSPGGDGDGGDTPAPGQGQPGTSDQHARTRGGSTARDGLTDGATAPRPEPARRTPRGIDLTM